MSTTFEHPRPMACPACVGLPDGDAISGPLPDADMLLSLPHIHCAACIAGVEKSLLSVPGVRVARVNLTLKRAAVRADATVSIDDLTQALARAGYEAQELDATLLARGDRDDYGAALLMRVGVAGFAMMNVMLLSVAIWSGAEGATRDLMHWISAAIALPAVAYAGVPFYTSAYGALRAGRLNMDVPITLAILLAAGTSLFETIHGGHHAYFDATISLAFFLLTGRYLEHRTRAAARSAAQELAALEVHRAIRIVNGEEAQVAVADLMLGDVVLVRAGANVPVDGRVIDGRSEVDRAFMTGESVPALVEAGAVVHAGEINLTGPLRIEVTAIGANTELRRIADLVALAESGRSSYASLADKAAGLYAPGVHILSALSAIGWFLYTWDARVALNIAAAVLIITCPCALGLAVPAVTTAVSGRLYRRGVLVKHETALERLAEVDTVVFDKTGTLTTGTPVPRDLDDLPAPARDVLAALTAGSSHPVSRAIAQALSAYPVSPMRLGNVTEVPGMGLAATTPSGEVRLGRAEWMGQEGSVATCLRMEDGTIHQIHTREALRSGAVGCLDALRDFGIRVVLLSGDRGPAVEQIASALGIDDWQADLMPADKAAVIADLQSKGRKVLMVGDGLNDTAALVAAHASMSPASALDAARVASDFVLLDSSLSNVVPAMDLARQGRLRIRQNLSMATLYNVVAVPLAVAGMATPLIAALAMSSSSLTVTLNALRLRR